MSLTQFSMVEELAFLIKDNLPCKHLVLSMENMLVDYLKDDTSLGEVLELEPMNPYNRLLLHRLADIFGFSHQSIGEGDDRHLVLKRCEDTSIPSILVADMLWDHDEYQSPVETVFARASLEDREAAYLEARKRIFSTEAEMEGLTKERPRNNPIVARRMIAHALGKRIKQSNQGICAKDATEYQEPTDEVQNQKCQNGSSGSSLQTRPKSNGQHRFTGSDQKVPQNLDVKPSTNVAVSGARKCDTNFPKHSLKDEHIGAAKRMFAHALRMHPSKETILSKSSQTKQADKS
ncbi:Single-stranded nucleic acid binding R3H [Cynara cardunculus var. scolymus]|uniref:Single-stranded nucleic acid binding R3H n=1 Tax=Cynara cardunculus var. scolymus TaxID=59895 RepID=A0A103YF32_CYNCS|nr:Single-stranded nucleic acid binding R3H [Cynara cardunculus var. scolymus]